MMRAAFGIYENPDLSASEVWSKGDRPAASQAILAPAGVLKAIGALSIAAAASTYAALRYTGLGHLVRHSELAHKLGL